MENLNQMSSVVNEFANSAELYDLSEKIGQKFGLLIDQIGAMDSEIRQVLLGVTKSKDFSANLVREADISHYLAEKIIVEINSNIFSLMRQKMQGEITEPHLSSIEKAGNFAIERDRPAPIVEDIGHDHKSQLLTQLENTQPLPRPVIPTPISYSDPLVDHLLKRPSSSNPEQINKIAQTQPITSPTPATEAEQATPIPPGAGAPKTPDQYREIA